MRPPGKLVVLSTVALLSLIWGTTWAAIRVGLRGVPPFTGVAIRFAVASAVLLLLAPLLGGKFERSRREKLLWISNGLLSFCASYGLLYWAEQWVPSGLASVLFATFPLFVAILAHLALPDEPLTTGTVVGTLLGFVGIAVIFSEDFSKLGGPHVALASTVLLAAPIVSAVSNVAIKKWGRGLHPFSLTAVPMGIAAGVMGSVAMLTERGRDVVWDAQSIGAILYLALPGSAVTFSLYYWLLSHLPATRVSLIAFTAPVVAVTVGAIFLEEPYTSRMIAGTALVLVGVALATYWPRRLIAKAAGTWVLACLMAHGAPPPLELPSDATPEALRSLAPLDGVTRVAVSDDLSRAAVARKYDAALKRTLLSLSAQGEAPREIEIDGEVRGLRFGPGDDRGLYILVRRQRHKRDPGEAVVFRLDPAATERPDQTRVPTTAADMDLSSDGAALLVACRNEIRVLTIPDLRSPRLFRALGDNRRVAAVPGGLRVVLGQPNALVVVDLGDRQGADGLPLRERVPVESSVVGLVAAPDASALIALLADGRTVDVRLDPLRIEPRGTASVVLWPGARIPLESPPSTEGRAAAPQDAPPPAAFEAPSGEATADLPAEPTAPAPLPATESVPVPETAPVPVPEIPPVAAPQILPVPDRQTILEPEPSAATEGTAVPGSGSVRGKLTGEGAVHVSAVVLFGPDNVLQEAMRVAPGADGTWSAGPLPPGVYRVVLDAGGRKAVVAEPPFLRIIVSSGASVTAAEMKVTQVMGP